MVQPEWFRRTTWTVEDVADFTARLKRARSAGNRAQYLRIQAGHLEQVGTEPLLRAALDLLQQLISEYPDTLELSSALRQQARCLAELGEYDTAIEAYRASVRAQRRLPSVHADAYRDFGELVVALGRSDLYEEVISLHEEFGSEEVWPAYRYQTAVTRAFIAAELGDWAEARHYASIALKAAAATESSFPRHRKLGLVYYADQAVLDRLRALAAER